MNHNRLITLRLPQRSIEKLDDLVGDQLYANRSEAMREAVKDLLANHERWNVKP